MHQEFDPSEGLHDVIKCFWYDSQDYGPVQSSFEVVPDGYAEIIFHFGGDCSISRDGTLQLLPSPFMVGLLDQPITFYAKERLEIVAIRCYPWTVFDLLGLPSSKGTVHVFRHAIAELQSTLQALIRNGEIEKAIAHVKQYFLRVRSQVSVGSMLFKAGVAMTKANGTLPVSQVAEAAHATVRTLERNFKQSSGHTVKDVSALMRFEQVRNRLWHQPGSNLAALASELGYADQSHLTKEFKRYSGTTPAAFARNATKGRRSVSTDFVAFVQA